MTAIRFVHTADIHLGKPFGNHAAHEALRAARAGVIGTLIEVARKNAAPHVLIAGDLFDSANPATKTWRHAVDEMAEASELTWWLLPGNHDSLSARDGAAATWEAMEALGYPNLRVLRDAQPVEMQPGAWLLPAPLATRRPASDPTAWMDGAETPPGAIRVGLAHGPVRDFSEAGTGLDVIAPDRDRRARLDWLALGDWHGAMRLSDRVAYAGSPERTAFGEDGRGSCFLVEIAAPGAPPAVERVETGRFDWRTITLDLLPGDDAASAVIDRLPDGARRDMLVRVEARGRLRLGEAAALASLGERIGPELCHFELRDDGLGTEVEAADLDAISTGGALREAANALAGEAASSAVGEAERQVAEAALRRLHGIMAEVSA
ncbi:exonuclease SbcCD subunit D [Roseobacter sp. HKCCA0434]|uniref:metallophosphoesterase family protein n=1 Tax=Roseobacter sp. HKCCA0434 TaxID=3079297 RepID=UPI002905BFDB|nr:metallophosphoesterase [Roseobacter sp. HKCCA0434]